ncbi:MAG: tRNA uridine(34) 5-carboxymethylaminomethyl modification radical SAM/GNAT enzyme Elp3 [Candidatus Gracilibacteria bacterium]|nr:tRNA uridine(34) 5-carboxymethylaminomethyl modification radical SAM/GNAT enzyme Elp3 [Candidatus Gracilibacteria bacterium]
MQNTQIIDEIINLSLERKIDNKADFHKTQNEVYKKYKLPEAIQLVEILERYNELIKKGVYKEDNNLKKVLRKRGVRSLSGVTVISLLTESFPCPGKCLYCPTFEGLPKSYIPNEPAVQRAKLNDFDPIRQIHNRLRALEITGHKIEKNDVRIIGGTWSFYPKKYRDNFIKGIYDAFNTYDEMKEHIEETDTSNDKFASFRLKEGYKLSLSKNLEEAKKINETARCRIIGIAVETRPDLVTPEEIKSLRQYGVTRVEIGYQTTIDEINRLNCRGHGNKESIEATHLLKDAGFKVVAHMMPNLLGSNPELDKKSMKEIWDNSDFRPDEIKIYPMVVTQNSPLTKIWQAGKFKAYDDETLIDLMCDLESYIPEYVRINRTYRDIPASEILHGSTLSNLRQIVENKLESKGIKMLDIRHREIKDKKNNPQDATLHTLKYEASGGTEYLLTFEDPEDRTIFSLLRLRLPNGNCHPELVSGSSKCTNLFNDSGSSPEGQNDNLYSLLPELQNSALIREIHTFGDQLSIGEAGSTFGQHIGFGKKLIEEAEKIAKENGYKKVAVIAGVGVREYYKKRGYTLDGEYMTKLI